MNNVWKTLTFRRVSPPALWTTLVGSVDGAVLSRLSSTAVHPHPAPIPTPIPTPNQALIRENGTSPHRPHPLRRWLPI